MFKVTDADYDAVLRGLDKAPVWTIISRPEVFLWALISSAPKALKAIPKAFAYCDGRIIGKGLLKAGKGFRSAHVSIDAWSREEGPVEALVCLPITFALFLSGLAFYLIGTVIAGIGNVLSLPFKRSMLRLHSTAEKGILH